MRIEEVNCIGLGYKRGVSSYLFKCPDTDKVDLRLQIVHMPKELLMVSLLGAVRNYGTYIRLVRGPNIDSIWPLRM